MLKATVVVENRPKSVKRSPKGRRLYAAEMLKLRISEETPFGFA